MIASSPRPIRRALLSVSDKTGIVGLAQVLHEQGVRLISTGGTAQALKQAGLPVQEVSDYTGFPEIMDGRVKTLHPAIHAGLLGRLPEDEPVMRTHKLEPIDLLVVNLYPFAQTVRAPGCDLPTAIEHIDIGGPTLLRAAAKNHARVTVIVDPEDYAPILLELKTHAGCTTPETRFRLAQKVFSHTAQYDTAIARFLNTLTPSDESLLPDEYHLSFTKKQTLRYGENPHQKAAFYVESNTNEPSISTAAQHQGKPLSFNNIADANAALECVKLFGKTPACVIVKHTNPCGVALSTNQLEAYQKAFKTDPTSAFGGVIAFNSPLETNTVKKLLEQQFVEVLIAPEIEPDALILLSKKPNVRVLSCGTWEETKHPSLDYTRVQGGLLIQEHDALVLSPNNLKIVTHRPPSVQEFNDLLFAWEVAKCVKSNAIVYAKERATIGIGAGQMSRVFSATIAALKANEADLSVAGSVMASDAFFPFRDGVDTAAKSGITAIIQPGGSVKDQEVIQAADHFDIAMVFTGIRHFKH